MPLYEYRCEACGGTIEVIQKFSDRPLRKCPQCSGRLRKLISRTSFQLKGGGWYSHGYGGSKPGAPAAKEGTASGSDSTPKQACGSGSSK